MNSWLQSIKPYFTIPMLRIGALGFASGLPLLLVGSSLVYWFAQLGVSKETIGIFALTGLPYSLKPLWAPFIDNLKLPALHTLLGRRRSWLLVTQFFLMLSLLGLGWSNPQENLFRAAIMTLMVTFWSATQDIIIDAYRIETLKPVEQTMGGIIVTFGYRIAMFVAGAGALTLSDHVGWPIIYTIMAILIGGCTLVTMLSPEPTLTQLKTRSKSHENWLIHFFWHPLKEFLTRPYAVAIVAFILLYQAGDYLMILMTMVFYKEMGFTGTEIALASKTVGLWATIFGSFVGGALALRYKLSTILFGAGLIHAGTNLILSIVALKGHSLPWLYIALISENFSLGIISSAFVGFLSILCNKEFSATQYALFSSLTAASRTSLQLASGFLASMVNWHHFFIICALMALPGLCLVLYLQKQGIFNIKKTPVDS